MEKKIAKLLENKYENVVQFNVVNTTPNPIFLDLFNTSEVLSSIPSSPTYIFPPNTYVGSFGLIKPYKYAVLNTSSQILYAIDGGVSLLLYDTANNNLNIGSINLGALGFSFGAYNSINNTIYFINQVNNSIQVIDCNTNTLGASISITNPEIIGFNSINNTMYVSGAGLGNVVINCNTNTIIATITAPAPFNTGYEFDSVNNFMYAGISGGIYVYRIDCTTNIAIPYLAVTNPQNIVFSSIDNKLFVYKTTSNIEVWDLTSATLITSISTSYILSQGYYDSVQNYIYWGTSSGVVIVINCNNNTILTTITIPSATKIHVGGINLQQNAVYYCVANINQIVQVTTLGITSTNYYISGSSNYNTFVNNLNNEPIEIQMIRLFVENQEQLYNQLQLTKIDSSGNQIFLPDFPINQVDIMQQQGNIGEISLKDVVFDGRTYINQYKINGYETISFEIYYTQLDLTSATPTFPIFFKPKIQLKEYINKELNL